MIPINLKVLLVKNIPNAITLANLAAGFGSIKLTFSGDYYPAVVLVIAAMILDYLDGKAARALGAESNMGKQLDSLSDLVSFGMAPAALCLGVVTSGGLWMVVILLVFLFSGVYRLARFNLKDREETKYFRGFPLTTAGVLLAVLTLYTAWLPFWFYYLLILVLALSMVSRLPYYSFKANGISRSCEVVLLVVMAAVVAASFFFPYILAVVLGLYYLSGLLLFAAFRLLRVGL